MSSVMRHFQDNSYLFGGNAPFIEELFQHENYLLSIGLTSRRWAPL